jgi:hypothetical protein
MQKTLFVTQAVTEYSTSDLEGVGTLRWIGGKCYRWVKNGNSSTAWIVGQTVFHKGGDYADIFTVAYEALTAQLMLMAGVCCSATPAASYGWVQVYGYNVSVSAKNASGTTYAIGDYLKGATGATYLTFDASTQAAYKKNVQLLEAAATVTTTLIAVAAYRCIINCLD